MCTLILLPLHKAKRRNPIYSWGEYFLYKIKLPSLFIKPRTLSTARKIFTFYVKVRNYDAFFLGTYHYSLGGKTILMLKVQKYAPLFVTWLISISLLTILNNNSVTLVFFKYSLHIHCEEYHVENSKNIILISLSSTIYLNSINYEKLWLRCMLLNFHRHKKS